MSDKNLCIIKIGRYEYSISEDDVFMDNGHCVQLLSQRNKSSNGWDRCGNAVLSKRAVKELSVFNKVEHKEHNHGESVTVFSLKESN